MDGVLADCSEELVQELLTRSRNPPGTSVQEFLTDGNQTEKKRTDGNQTEKKRTDSVYEDISDAESEQKGTDSDGDDDVSSSSSSSGGAVEEQKKADQPVSVPPQQINML